METSEIFAFFIYTAAFALLILWIYFIYKQNEKNHRVSQIIKTYPSLVKTLCNVDNVFWLSRRTKEQTTKILSLSDKDWEEWLCLSENVQQLADKYPETLFEFFNEYMPGFKDRINYKNKVALFTPRQEKVKAAIESLMLDELRKVDAEPESTWKQRDDFRICATQIRQKYPDGYKTYCSLQSNKKPTYSEIVTFKKRIIELQKLYDESKNYEGWEEKQKEFSDNKYYEFVKVACPNSGRYTYNIQFKKPDRKGILTDSMFKVWQGFYESFSSSLLDRQTESFLKNYKKLESFKKCTRYFYDHVYEEIFEIVKNIIDTIDGELHVCFVDKSKYNWPDTSYNYHYGHIRRLLEYSDISKFNLSDLPSVEDKGNIGVIFILDFITTNEDLKRNCKYIIEHFKKSVPLLGYYSMEKEYDKNELLELAKKSERYLKSEETDIKFIKECLLRVEKHSFYSYMAIPNTWVGNANRSEEIKRKWLDEPNQYTFRTKDVAGHIAGYFSVDGGWTVQEISIEGDRFNVDDVAKFTFLLFKKMGILSQFKEKGNKAIEYMNEQGMLAHH